MKKKAYISPRICEKQVYDEPLMAVISDGNSVEATPNGEEDAAGARSKGSIWEFSN
ncbi:MAG: hypothetical protein IJ604_10265 [Prevotella sp.]|nr:hypothetical protein [Prevotella sp.]